MTWYVLGFWKESSQSSVVIELPESVDEREIGRMVGEHAKLKYGDFLIPEYAGGVISEKYGIAFDFEANVYFVRFSSG